MADDAEVRTNTKSIEVRQIDPALLDPQLVPRNAEVLKVGGEQRANLALNIWMFAMSPGRGRWTVEEVSINWRRWRQRAHIAVESGWKGVGWSGAPLVCRPPVTKLNPNTGWRYCTWRLCVFCHAQRAAKAYSALCHAVQRLNAGAGLSVFRCRYEIKRFRDSYNWFQRNGIVAGYTGRISVRPMVAGNSVTAVVLADRKQKPPDMQRGYGPATPEAIFLACVCAIRYPNNWLKLSSQCIQGVELANRVGGRAWVPYGACRRPRVFRDNVYVDDPDPALMEEWGLTDDL